MTISNTQMFACGLLMLASTVCFSCSEDETDTGTGPPNQDPDQDPIESGIPTAVASDISRTLGSTVLSTEVNGHHLFVGTVLEGLISFDISDMQNPEELDEQNFEFSDHDPYSLSFSNGRIWVGSKSQLYLMDVSSPESLAEKKSYQVEGEIFTNVVSGNRIYTAENNFGFHILDISNELDLKYIGGYNPSGSEGYRYMDIKGSYCFMVGHTVGLPLDVIDFSSESDPFLAKSLELLPGSNHFKNGGVVISGNYLYASAFDEGLIIVDISTPTSPSVIGAFDPDPSNSNSIAELDINGTFGVISDLDYGIHVIDLSEPATPKTSLSYEISGGISGGVLSGKHFIGINGQSAKQLNLIVLE